MSRPRVRRRSDGITEIVRVPPRRERARSIALALASAAMSSAAVALTWLKPALLSLACIPVAAAVMALLASTLLRWRSRQGRDEPRATRSPRTDPAPVHPIRPLPGASTHGA